MRELLADAAERELPMVRFVVRAMKIGPHYYGDFNITIQRIPESNL